MLKKVLSVLTLLVSASAARGGADSVPATFPLADAVDHHVHLLGDDLLRDWKTLGATFSKPDAAYRSAERVLGPAGHHSEGAGFGRAVLVPMAHLYGSEEFRAGLGLSLEEERARTERENDHVAREAARYPGRAVALCSASALRPYAQDELARCHSQHRAAGLKLHLASSGVDLREPAHLTAVERLLAWAEKEGLPVLLHLDTQRRGTTTDHVRQFLEQVLAPHPRLSVLVAHLGGSGGYGAWTRSVFRTVATWIEAEKAAGRTRSIYFDLSAVLLEEASEGVPPTTAEETRMLAADLRELGAGKIVFGSDYPVFDPHRIPGLLAERAGLSPSEIAVFLTRAVPDLFPPRPPPP